MRFVSAASLRAVGVSVLTASLLSLVLLTVGTEAADAVAPSAAWTLQAAAEPTNMTSSPERNSICLENGGNTPTSCDWFAITPTNVGGETSVGSVKVEGVLPQGITTAATPRGAPQGSETGEPETSWACTEGAGQRTFVCEAQATEVPSTAPATPIVVPVIVSPQAPPGTPLTAVFTIVGGGAPDASTVETSTNVDGAPPAFGPLAFTMSLVDAAGRLSTEAGAHPGGLTVGLLFPTEFAPGAKDEPSQARPVQAVKQVVTDLPPGVVGDARAAATCSLTGITQLKLALKQCPLASRVGRLALLEPGGGNSELVIFNVPPERSYAAEFAVYLPGLSHAELLYARLVGSGADAHVRVTTAPQASLVTDDGFALTFFGDPAVHDGGATSPQAFFTDPSDCGASSFTSTIYVDSWQTPGRFEADGEPDLTDPNWKRETSVAPPVTGCESLKFQPSLTFAPEADHQGPDEPAGYESVLKIPQNENLNGLATPPLKTTTVTLPPGVAISPSAAVGLEGCEPGAAGIGLERESEANQPGHCPEASKVGQVEAVTPVLEEPLKGSVYVAEPKCGGYGESACTEEAAERGEVFAIYLELGSENFGVHVKLKGQIEVGGNGQHSHEAGLKPGQVRTTFAQTPQDPVSELKLKFHGGQRAPLANPQSCGLFTTGAELEPWSHTPAPGERSGTPNAVLDPSFAISGCESKFDPAFTAGTTSPQAGGYSPFTLTFSRQDREQDLSGITVNMPPGLIGKIAGIPQCGETQANAGSCSSASQIGTATGAAGSGSQPLYQSGPVYLTGPYKGAPFGLSIVVPAVAGPFNLGNIVVRTAISVNPTTAAITVVSDPLPQSVDGVPLRLKTVNVTVGSAGNFTFNPTNCAPQEIGAELTGADAASVPVASRFQVANCGSLPFKPVLSASVGGRASKAGGASLDVKVSYPSGPIGSYANVKSVKVDLPKQLPSRLTTLQKACLAATFQANPANCPAASDVGTATARTPVLNVPLEGPAYLVSHGGEAFPDLEIVLQGENVELILDGNTQIKKGITSSTFKSIPDAPVSGFELKMPTGRFSILTANVEQRAHYSLCGQTLVMPTEITAQNGAVIKQRTKIGVTNCLKTKRAKPKNAKPKKSSRVRNHGKRS